MEKNFFQNQLLHVIRQIEKSKSPEANMKWFLSEEARFWYQEYKNKPPYVEIAEELNEENKFEEVFNPKD